MKTDFGLFHLTSTYKGDKNWHDSWSADCPENWNNHMIMVQSDLTGKAARFEFWESIVERKIRTRKQLLNAFWCFLSDCEAVITCRDWRDFQQEFGYENDADAKRVYRACQHQWEKAQRLGLNETSIYETIEKLEEEIENENG